MRSFSKLDRLLLGLLALVLLSLFALAISLPLYGHDIAEHSKSAAIIAQAKDFSVYPLHGYKGVFTQAKHPPTVIGLWVWQYFFYLRDSYDQTLLGKLISPSVALLTCLALIGFAEKRRQTLAILGSIVLLCTPLMYTNVASSHVDINRGATYLGAALWLLLCLRSPSWPLAIMTGLAIGLAARVHLSSLVIGPLLATSYLAIAVFRKGFKWSALKSDVAICSLMALAALAVCGFDYVRMLYIYGKNVVSTEEGFSVVANSGINYRAYVEIVRNIHGIPQKIFNGLLKGFTDIELMGLTYWLALVGVLVLAIRRRFDTQLAVFMLQFLFFLILLALAVLFSFDLLLKNSRYYLMFQPFVAVLACAALEPLYEKNTEI
ncbi:hypothetical protein FAK_05940 [Desulfoferula mesophila]|uniref:Glycosyltransferase RgtA/B/C/D-like domain-containing protein n=1 Tax=Desulfoferula mesophila TaxID=3058419 RepID=A0AAU9EUS3_9BACT|nr:hypothetical protein FAK_05940 [Desulfoferula mesophilus]